MDVIQALKITPETYNIYLLLPLPSHLDLKLINNKFIVFDTSLPTGHGWFEKRDFDRFYKVFGKLSKTKLTPVIKLPPE